MGIRFSRTLVRCWLVDALIPMDVLSTGSLCWIIRYVQRITNFLHVPILCPYSVADIRQKGRCFKQIDCETCTDNVL